MLLCQLAGVYGSLSKKKPLYAPCYINLHVNVFHPSVTKEEQLLHLDFGHIGEERSVDIYRRINVKNWMIPYIDTFHICFSEYPHHLLRNVCFSYRQKYCRDISFTVVLSRVKNIFAIFLA